MKVSIIGASVSGLFTAYLLAKKGIEVEVYEKEKELGWPPRTLIATNKIAEVLDFVPEEAIINRIKYFEFFSKSGSVKLELSQSDLVIERTNLIRLLARLVEREGAHISLQNQFKGFIRTGEKVEVTLKALDTGEEFRVSVDVLVGADGAQSAVSRAASRDGHLLASLIQAKTEFREGVKKDTTQVWFDSNLTRYFSWLIPESERIGTMGLIADGRGKAQETLNRFVLSKQAAPLDLQTAPVPIHRFEFFSNHAAYGNNIFFVGDAGAQVKVTTVGGVVAGLHGARALANAILNGRNYPKELRGLKRELDLHLLVRRVLNWFNEKDYDQLIGIIDGRFKDVLGKWTRDELTQSFFKLILAEPRLITLGAKACLRSILGN